MKTLRLRPRLVAAATVGCALFAAVSAARADVWLSVNGQAEPAPVYVQPAPVYVQPETVYVQPQPSVVYTDPKYMTYQQRREWEHRKWEERREQAHREWERRQWQEHHRRDWDGDRD